MNCPLRTTSGTAESGKEFHRTFWEKRIVRRAVAEIDDP